MSTIPLIKPSTPSAVADLPTFAEMLEEVLPLMGVVAVAGPPVVFLLGPLVLFTLMLVGAFTLAVTLALALALVVVPAAAGVVVVLVGPIVAPPYVLVRRLRRHGQRDARIGVAERQLVGIESRHRAA